MWFKQLQHYEFEKTSDFQELFSAFSCDSKKERYLNLWSYNHWKGAWTDSPEEWSAVFVHQTGAAVSAWVGPEPPSTATATLPLLRSWGNLSGQKAVEGMGIEIWRLFLSFSLTCSAQFVSLNRTQKYISQTIKSFALYIHILTWQ